MPQLTSGTLSSAAGGNRQFLTGTVTWNGGTGGTTIDTTQDLGVELNGVVYGTGCHIIGQYGTTAGANVLGGLVLENSTWEMSQTGNRTFALSTIWNNVTILRLDSGYSAWGAWNANAAGSVPDWTNVNLYGSVDFANNEVGLSPFFGAAGTTDSLLDADSNTVIANIGFRGVRYWNGETGDEARGAAPQLGTGGVHAGPVFGPFGGNFNGTYGGRFMSRFSNQGNTNADLLNNQNHRSLVTDADYRAISTVNSTEPFYFALDTGAHASFINPLVGLQTGTGGNWAACPFAAATSGNDFGGWYEVFVGTNPVVTTDSGDHRYSVPAATIPLNEPTTNYPEDANDARGLVLLPAADFDVFTTDWDTAYATNQVFDNPVNGFLFRQTSYRGNSTNTSATLQNSGTPLVALNDETYRKYSWQQQPDDATFGREIMVDTPVAGATDEQVATARAAGFDTHDGTNWTSSTNVDDPVDAITSADELDTVAKATAITGTTANHFVAKTKALAYNNVTQANVGTANTRIPVGYTISGTTVTYAGDITVAAAGADSRTGTTSFDEASVTMTNLESTAEVTAISAPNITIAQNLTGTNAKPALSATTALSATGSLDTITLAGGSAATSLADITNVTYTGIAAGLTTTGDIVDSNITTTVFTQSGNTATVSGSTIASTGIMTLNTANISNTTLTTGSSGSNILFGTGGFGDNVTVTTTGTASLNNGATGSGTTFNADTISGYSVTATRDGVTAFGDGTVSISLTETTGVTDINATALFGSDVTEGTGAITLNSTTPIIVRVANTSTSRLTGGTNVQVLVILEEYTITFPQVAGNYVIRTTDGINTPTIASGATSTSATSVTINTTQYASANDVTIYWTGAGHLDVVQAFTGMDASITAVADANLATADIDGTTIAAAIAGGVTTYTGTTSVSEFTAAQTNVWWDSAKAFAQYTESTYTYRETNPSDPRPLIQLTSQTSVSVNGDYIRFASGTSGQQTFSNLTNTGTTDITTTISLNASQIIFQNEGAYTSAQAQLDYETAGLATESDLSNLATASDLTSLEKGVGYLVGGQNATDATSRAQSNLTGIKPKAAPYDPNESYEDVL